MLQQHIDKEIIELLVFVKANCNNILDEEWDSVFMDWTYLLHHIDDYHIIISLLYEKWANVYKNVEWENDQYKEVYENLLQVNIAQAQEAWRNYEQMRHEAKGIEKMLYMLRTFLQWLNNLNILAKNNGEICQMGHIFIVYYGYKKSTITDFYKYDALRNDVSYYLKIVESLLCFFRDKSNLYYIYSA